MKKNYFRISSAPALISFSIIFSFYSEPSFAQAGMWTWMKGDSIYNLAGNFGTQGVSSPTNNPPGLYGPARYTDLNGNFWIFGGVGLGGNYSDLWKYDPSTNEWTWMKGPGTPSDPGDFGIMGVPSPTNNPGARGYGAASWTDLNGNFWLFGGTGSTTTSSGSLADLWKYDPLTNEWTWMKGNSGDLADFGTLQVPAPTNTPGMRDECTANWVDLTGNLWLYGSKRDNSLTSSNDMWKYDISLNQWVWMSGSQANNVSPSYGTQKVFAPTNTPGSRMNHCGITDHDGNFWLFGGYLILGPYYADLWKYDPLINQWAWMSGSNVTNDPGNSGLKCDTSHLFNPSYRFENRAGWVDNNNDLWMMTGFGSGDVNDLWIYHPPCDLWSWVSGSIAPNEEGTYGTMGVPSPNNIPGARGGAVSFYDTNGDMWLIGGRAANQSGDLNDVWKFTPDPSCPASLECLLTVAVGASDSAVCEKFCIDFTDQSVNNPTTWLWLFEGGIPGTSTDQNPTNICYDIPGTYDVTLITTSASGTDTLTMTDFITVYATPPFPVITQNGLILTSSPAVFYQWQFNSVDIPGATNQSYTVTQSGFYTVVVSDSNGCVNSATIFVEITGLENLNTELHLSIYPNPSDGNFFIECTSELGEEFWNISLTNTIGKQVFFEREASHSTLWKKEINLNELASGVYYMELWADKSSVFVRKKIVISQ